MSQVLGTFVLNIGDKCTEHSGQMSPTFRTFLYPILFAFFHYLQCTAPCRYDDKEQCDEDIQGCFTHTIICPRYILIYRLVGNRAPCKWRRE